MTERILIGSRSFGQTFPEHLRALEEAGCEVIPNTIGRAYREEELMEALPDVDAIITGTDQLTRAVILGADALRVIAKHGAGTENIDLAAAEERGIVVSATPGAMSEAVAELAFGLMLALARSIVPAHVATAGGAWPRLVGSELNQKTLGLIGLGRIAKAVASRAQAFGMTVIAADPFVDEIEATSLGIELCGLPALLERADFVSLHAAATAGDRPLLGAEELALMQNTAFLINTSRGMLIDELQLADALQGGRIAGAALDVFSAEPPTESPLLGMNNVITTPHLGGQTREALKRMGEQTVAHCIDGLRRSATSPIGRTT